MAEAFATELQGWKYSGLSELDRRLARLASRYKNDPLGFIRIAWRWGEDQLKDERLRVWQIEVSDLIGRELRARVGQADQVVRIAIATGHGVGKSALMAMLSHWGLATMADTRGVITANTETQLRTKTWAEMAKWNELCIFKDWFQLEGSSLHATGLKERSWRIDKIPWSEHNPEAFAGLHNVRRRVLVLFDEASAIARTICETAEGMLTDEYTQCIFVMFGNATRNSGYFYDAFHSKRDVWHCFHLDARQIEGTNKEQIRRWEEEYGEDSDFFRVRVRGQFPRLSDMQFIPQDDIRNAQLREARCMPYDPFIMGIDVAWTGSAESVIAFRKGFDARTQPWIKLRGRHTDDLTLVASRAIVEARRYQPDMIFVDAEGPGALVYYAIKNAGWPVTPCRFGRAATDSDVYGNKRAECWGRMKEWLHDGGAIPPDDHQLAADLAGPEYHFKRKTNQIILTSKEDMLRLLGLPSPDAGDGLAATFYEHVAPRRFTGGIHRYPELCVDYDASRQPPADQDVVIVPTLPAGGGFTR